MKRILVIASVMALGGVSACATAQEQAEPAAVEAEHGLIDSLAAIIVPVSDLEAASAFYLGTLEASVLREMEVEAYKERILSLPGGEGPRLVLIESKVAETQIKPVRIVFNTHRAENAVNNAVALGAKLVRAAKPVPGAGVTIGLVQDGDGNTLEFLQR